MRRCILTCLTTAVFLCDRWAGVDGRSVVVTLLHDLMSTNYTRYVRPVVNTSTVTTVKMGMSLHQVIDVNEVSEYLKLNIWLTFYWTDEFLVWEPRKYEGVSKIHIPSDQIWRPDVILYNSADDDQVAMQIYANTDAVVLSDGEVEWPTPVLVTSTCSLNAALYPFDVQRCWLKFSSWTHSITDVDIRPLYRNVSVDNYVPDGEWDILETKCQRNEINYSNKVYPDLTFHFVLKRKPLFYLYNLLFPCIVLTLTDAMVFLLPPESGEKVTLAITVLLAMMVFLTVIMQNVPTTSLVIPLLEQFFGAMIAHFTMTVLLVVFVVNVHHRGNYCGRPAPWVRRLFLQRLSRCFRMRMPSVNRKASCDNCKHANDVANGCGVVCDEGTSNPACSVACPTNGTQDTGEGFVDVSSLDLKQLPGPVWRLRDSGHEADHDGMVDTNKDVNEWHQVARVLDRLFLVIYLILIVVYAFVVFGILI